MARLFTADDLLDCYRRGVFPMARSRDDPRLFLIDPPRRAILPLERFHLPRRLARTVRSGRFDIRVDTAFEAIIDACAAPRPDETETWINAGVRALYGELHRRGFVHSVETWRGDRLAGGLYGLALGGAFFGESMVSVERDASKVALVHLIERLRIGGFVLLDAQFMTDHLAQFGAVEIDRNAYQRRLAAALLVDGTFGAASA